MSTRCDVFVKTKTKTIKLYRHTDGDPITAGRKLHAICKFADKERNIWKLCETKPDVLARLIVNVDSNFKIVGATTKESPDTDYQYFIDTEQKTIWCIEAGHGYFEDIDDDDKEDIIEDVIMFDRM